MNSKSSRTPKTFSPLHSSQKTGEAGLTGLTSSYRTHLLFLPLLAVAFVAAYHSTLSWMYGRYVGVDSYYSHGFLIPFVTGFLIWQKRNKLREIRIEGSRIGLLFIILGIIIHLLGTILFIFSISGFSIFFLVIGIALYILGKDVVRMIFFPLIFLLFMFPIPEAFIGAISFPMKMVVAKTGVDIVRFLGIPVFREGFNISIPAGELLVGNPCSGLRSLIAFMALGSVFAYLVDTSQQRKWILFLSSIPIAILSNIVRVPILILVSHFWGLEAAAPESFWHTASGVLVFVLGLGLLYSVGRMLQWKN